MAKTIDIHTGIYPKEWMEYLEKRTESPRMERTGPTSLIFYVKDYPVAHADKRQHDPEVRINDMDDAGIDTQILALDIPSVELIDAHEGVIWARRINDSLAEVCQQYPGRFYANATLPYQDVNAAIEELERAYKKLGLKGIMLFSNINGKPVASPEFYPIYAKAEEYGLPILLHPAAPLTLEIMKTHRIPAAVFGYTFDTTIAIMSLIWQGILEKYPRLVILHSHLGGVVPYLIGRIDNWWCSYPDELNLKLSKIPSEYYKSQVYTDTISNFLPAMKCCLDFIGPEHICLGSDYGHRADLKSTIVRSKNLVRNLGLSEEDTNKILGGNAARIYKLEQD